MVYNTHAWQWFLANGSHPTKDVTGVTQMFHNIKIYYNSKKFGIKEENLHIDDVISPDNGFTS